MCATLVSKAGRSSWLEAVSPDRSPAAGVPWLVTAVPFLLPCGDPACDAARGRPRPALGFPGDFVEEPRGGGGRQRLGAEAVHDFHVVIDIVALIEVERAGELFDVHHVRQVSVAEPQD